MATTAVVQVTGGVGDVLAFYDDFRARYQAEGLIGVDLSTGEAKSTRAEAADTVAAFNELADECAADSQPVVQGMATKITHLGPPLKKMACLRSLVARQSTTEEVVILSMKPLPKGNGSSTSAVAMFWAGVSDVEREMVLQPWLTLVCPPSISRAYTYSDRSCRGRSCGPPCR